MSLEQTLPEALRETLASLGESATLDQTLGGAGLDSLDAAELVLRLEDRCGCPLVAAPYNPEMTLRQWAAQTACLTEKAEATPKPLAKG